MHGLLPADIACPFWVHLQPSADVVPISTLLLRQKQTSICRVTALPQRAEMFADPLTPVCAPTTDSPESARPIQHKKSARCLFYRPKNLRFVGNFGRVANARSLRGAALSLQSAHQQDGQMIVWKPPCGISMCESRQRWSLPLLISAKRVTHETGCPLSA